MNAIPSVRKSFIAGCLALFAVSTPLAAKNVTLYPDADTFVRGASERDQNFGTGATFLVRGSSNRGFNRVAYVRFGLGDEVKPGSTFSGSTFTIRLASVYRDRNEPSTLKVYGLNHDYRPGPGQLGQDWNEETLTNENAPWAAPHASEPPSFVTYLGELPVPGRGQAMTGQEFSVSGEVLDRFLNTGFGRGQRLFTFIIVEPDNSSNSIAFVARENTSFEASTLSFQLATR